MLQKKKIMQNCHPFSKLYFKFYLFIILFFLLGLIWFLYNLFVGCDWVLCPTKRFFNLPCPGCGITRAFIELINGNIVKAIYYNANIIVLAPLFFFIFLSVLNDFIYLKINTYNLYIKLNNYINKGRFIIVFIFFELLVECHHVIFKI